MSDNEDDFFGLADGQILSSDGESDGEDARGSGGRGSESASLSPQRRDSPRPAKKVAGAKKAKKRGRGDGSDDEGEVSDAPGSPDSLQSAPMDESDSDAEVPAAKTTARPTIEDDDDENKYPVEGIFASLAEKEDIMAMDELRRETILADRKLEIDRERQNRLLRQLVSNQESEEKKQKKRKASSADLDDEDTRKTPRARTGGKNDEASSKYDTLRRKRAELSDRVRAREERRRRGRSITPNRRPSTRESDDFDDDRHKPGRSQSPPRKISLEPATLRDIEHVRVGRSRFAHVCFYPGFEDTITGCFARVNVGPDPDTGNQVYRMAIIKGFNTGKPYALPGRSSQIVTDQYVTLGVGKATRDWPFIMCSDGKFTEAEFSRYKKTCEVEGTSFPKSQTLINKVDEIDALLNRAWTAEEMQQKVDRQNALLKKFMPKNKDQLHADLERARAAGDSDRIADLEEKLASADAPRLAFRTSLQQPPAAAAKNQQDTLAEINRRNRRINAEEVRKAQVREKNHQRKMEEDPVRRLMSQKKMNQARKELNGGGSSRGSTPAVGTPKLVAKDASNGGEKKPVVNPGAAQNGVPSFHRPVMDDDVIGSLDLGIDDDIEI